MPPTYISDTAAATAVKPAALPTTPPLAAIEPARTLDQTVGRFERRESSR
jgi:hypothetical protein